MRMFLLGVLDVKSPTGRYYNYRLYRMGLFVRKILKVKK